MAIQKMKYQDCCEKSGRIPSFGISCVGHGCGWLAEHGLRDRWWGSNTGLHGRTCDFHHGYDCELRGQWRWLRQLKQPSFDEVLLNHRQLRVVEVFAHLRDCAGDEISGQRKPLLPRC